MIDALDEIDQLRFFKYVKDYGLYNKEPELTGVERAAWVSMKALIDNLSDRRGAPSGNANAARAPEPEPPAPQTGDGGQENGGDTNSTISTNSTNSTNSDDKVQLVQKVQKVQLVQSFIDIDSNYNSNSNSCAKNFENSAGPPFLPPPNPPAQNSFGEESEKPPDYALEFQDLTSVWNDEGRKMPLPPFKRDIFSLTSDQRESFVRARQNFSVAEIINAVKNYQFVRDRPETYEMRHNYRSLFTFLEKGVGTFYKDDLIDPQFLRKKREA